MKIVRFFADNELEMNCSIWRMFIPHEAMVRAGHTDEIFHIKDFVGQPTYVKLACQQADIILVERNAIGPTLNEIVNWRNRDKPVVIDFDDAYHKLPTTHVVYGHWREGIVHLSDGTIEHISPTPVEQFATGLHLASAFTTPSPYLVKDWEAHAPGYHLPNFLDLAKYQGLKREEHDGIWIGWGGSVSHFLTMENAGVIAGLRRACLANPKIKVIVQTSDPRVLKSMRDIPENQRVYKPWVPFAQWPQSMCSWDISLAVAKGEYDGYRSLIHLTEPLAFDQPIPVLASNSLPYSEWGDYVTLVKNTPKDWEYAINEMADNLEYHRQGVAGAPHQWALGYGIDANLGYILEQYQEIIDNEKD